MTASPGVNRSTRTSSIIIAAPARSELGAKFLLTTFGSLGDLHPYIAVGIGLRERGHSVTIGTSEMYRAKVEGEGLQFHPLRPDLSGLIDRPEVMRRAMHPRTGTRY